MHLDIRAACRLGKGPDPLRLADVDQDQPGYARQVDIPDALELVGINGALQKKVTQAALLGAGEDHLGLRIELFGSDHGAEAVEISVDVGGDDFHECLSPRL
jgi:hypothetical protein